MKWIDFIHRWTGGLIGLLLAVMGLTGTLLIYKDAWLRATVPHAEASLVTDPAAVNAAVRRLVSSTPAHQEHVINGGGAATRRSTTHLNSIIFPDEHFGAYRVSFDRGTGAYADQSGAIVARWASKWDRLELWLFDLHHHLWMGNAGTKIVGVLALIGLGFVVTGLLLWWRVRKEFRLRALPARMTRLQIVRHHRDLGTVASPLLIVLLLTGAMLALRPVAQFLLSPLSSSASIAESLAPPAMKGGPLARDFDWSAMLQSVRAAFPEAELRTINLPRREGQLIRVRVRQPHEWLPNGRTLLWFDAADGRLVEVQDAKTLPLATRAYNLVYPIHASKVGGFLYTTVMTAAGLVLTMLGSLTVYSFWGYRLRRRTSSVPISAHPA